MEKVTLTLNEQTRALLRATGNASSYVRKVTDQRQMEWVSALAWLEKNGWTTSRITREMPSPGEPLLVVGETQAHALDRLDAEAGLALYIVSREFWAGNVEFSRRLYQLPRTILHVSISKAHIVSTIKARGARAILDSWTGTDAEAIAAVEADRRDFFACDCPSPKEDGSCPGHSVK